MGVTEGAALSDEIRERLDEALRILPDRAGGTAIVMATGGIPPAMAMLSTGDVHLAGDVVRVGVHVTSSVVTRLGDSFTLFVPLRDMAVRLEFGSAIATEGADLALIEGELTGLRPTAEPPWRLEMRFWPGPEDHPMIPVYVAYWSEIRAWLAGEAEGPPAIPRP